MFLHLVYASFAAEGFSGAALSDLVERSRIKNEQRNITAVLLHQRGVFLHGIEGEEAEVRALFTIVHADPRHRDAQVLVATQVSKRLFTHQPMGFHHADLETLRSAQTNPGSVASRRESTGDSRGKVVSPCSFCAPSGADGFGTGLLPVANTGGRFRDLEKVVGTQPTKILVVEDHPDTLTMLGMVLELLGHHCALANEARSALAKAAQERFDAMLTDVNLPGMDGWELLAELASLGLLPGVVISMSAGDDFIQAKRSKALGCHAHLVKPFRHDELESALNRHLPGPATVSQETAPGNRRPT